MSRPFTTRRPENEEEPTSADRSSSSPAAAIERFRRWGALVAVGEAPLPVELKPAELKIVLTEVARLRRERLVRFIACAIAKNINGERRP